MTDIRTAMPLLARHEGIWEGVYRYVDPAGKTVDEHQSRLVVRFPQDGPYAGHNTNHYTWANGKKEVRDFKSKFRDGRLWFDNDLITGWLAEEPLDNDRRSVVLSWTRKGEPHLYLYEMIQLSDCGRYRSRIWQWFDQGKIHMRTLIDEEKVSDDPQAE